MSRIRSLLKSRAGHSSPATTAAVRYGRPSVELLENRRLLSASPAASTNTPIATSLAASLAVNTVKSYGVTLNLAAGQSFTGYLGALAGGSVNLAAGKITATINWGDGALPTPGIITPGSSGHIDVGGSHTFATAGSYSITINLFQTFNLTPGKPSSSLVILLGSIESKANVAGKSAGGIEIAESVGAAFTARLGTFTTSVPAAQLSATVAWGDGAISAATLNPVGAAGKFEIDASHTYRSPGEFPIRILVVQNPGSGAAAKPVTTIQSKAVVTTPITGSYQVLRAAPDTGATYSFTGVGRTGTLPLTFTGSVALPGLIAAGRATGSLTLRTSEGSVTFKATGPTQTSSALFPRVLTYMISASTGAYAGTTGSGTLSVTLSAAHQTFVLLIRPA